MLSKAIEKFLHNVITAKILFSQSMNPDCIIHTAVEGSKDEGVHLTTVARIREISLCNFHGLLPELPFPVSALMMCSL